jgi:hypothetical protein
MNESTFQVVIKSKGRLPVDFEIRARDLSKGTITIGLLFEKPENISANGVR